MPLLRNFAATETPGTGMAALSAEAPAVLTLFPYCIHSSASLLGHAVVQMAATRSVNTGAAHVFPSCDEFAPGVDSGVKQQSSESDPSP